MEPGGGEFDPNSKGSPTSDQDITRELRKAVDSGAIDMGTLQKFVDSNVVDKSSFTQMEPFLATQNNAGLEGLNPVQLPGGETVYLRDSSIPEPMTASRQVDLAAEAAGVGHISDPETINEAVAALEARMQEGHEGDVAAQQAQEQGGWKGLVKAVLQLIPWFIAGKIFGVNWGKVLDPDKKKKGSLPF